MKHLLSAFLLGITPASAAPVPVIFDTDMGNDVDDVMALAMLHSLQHRGHCEVLAVTISKDHELAAPFVDAINTFYGNPDIPIGVVRNGATPDEGKFNQLANATAPDGKLIFPHDLRSGNDAPEAVALIRKTLASRADGSVVMIQVGFFTNLSRLLDSKPDDASPLTGEELVRKKVRVLSLMAGAFTPIDGNPRYAEYNVVQDVAAAQSLASRWPTPRIWSGFEIGIAVPFPHQSIEQDFQYVPHHPLKEAYYLHEPPPHDRPTWDPTAVLQAVLPDRGYFQLSETGRITVEPDGVTNFQPAGDGSDRFVRLEANAAGRPREAIVLLSSEPIR
ncbi:MAG: nucleoside hydrolase [Luteolibacter sp.]|uniref:nucleoside hydrolase n=1 Tax=Luteolibacter sp. TaxID=1962973 RepID=UPI003265E7B2